MQVLNATPSRELTYDQNDAAVPPGEAVAYRRFTGFHTIPRPNPLASVAIGGQPATAKLDLTVHRLRARDELLLRQFAADQFDSSRFYRLLTLGIGGALLCWIAIGVVLAWLAGRL